MKIFAAFEQSRILFSFEDLQATCIVGPPKRSFVWNEYGIEALRHLTHNSSAIYL